MKVLISGGSLTGLTLALALQHGGIDFLVLEKGEIGPELGASIALQPQSIRILAQLGVWKDIEEIVTGLEKERVWRVDATSGHVFEKAGQLGVIAADLGWPLIFIERRRLLRLLYSHIQDKSKVHDHTAVVSYEEDSDGIIVTTADGRSFRGDILIGADGIHSRVRAVMSERIRKENHALSKEIDQAFTSEYQALFGISRCNATSFLPDRHTVYNVSGNNYSAIVTAGQPDLMFWFLFVKTSRTSGRNIPRYTDEDAQAVIDCYGRTALGPKKTIQDLWDTRLTATLVPMEDGIVEQWSHGRVLLLGDSAHKVTINAGLGGNLALEAITHFTNSVVSLLQRNPQPTLPDLTALFSHFNRVQRPRADIVRTFSTIITRSEGQETWFLKFHARYISPWLLSDQARARPFLSFARDAPWLEFVPLPVRVGDLPVRKNGKEKTGRWMQSIANWSVVGSGAVLATATAAAISIWRRYRR
ncbi:hypothetical protein VTN77DRAFT_6896 [Rasamsonia byssochlamydoides]|uniref:uncharacterized protein n=1 Tax=Rasamsonia byssochlamydoides TaxID=89139 RepID=UPI003743732D